MQEKDNEMPIGFALSMAMNEEARNKFAAMDNSQREKAENLARQVQSKAEMDNLVDNIAKGTTFLS